MDQREIRTRLLQSLIGDAIAVLTPADPEILKFFDAKTLNFFIVTNENVKILAHPVFEEELERSKLNYELVITKDPENDLKKSIEKRRVYGTSRSHNLLNFKFFDLTDFFKQVLKKPLEEDIVILKELAGIIDRSITSAILSLRIGMKEYEFKAEIDYNLEKNGVLEFSYPTIVTFGERTAYPSGFTSDRILKEGDIVQLDTAPVYKGYESSVARVLFTEENAFWLNKLNVLNEVLKNTVEKLYPGTAASYIDMLMRTILAKRGFSYPHYSGRALGGFYEPMIYPGSADVLERNMFFSLEPGIYIKKKGGLRIRNQILINETGAEILDFPRV